MERPTEPKGHAIRRFQIELVRHSYQPNKAELEEEVDLDVPGDAALAKFKRMTRAMVQLVTARLRNRR